MLTRALSHEQAEAYATEFEQTGFCIIPAVLTPREVELAKSAILGHRELQPGHWRLYGKSRDGGPIGEEG